jgi:hypothetical protein
MAIHAAAPDFAEPTFRACFNGFLKSSFIACPSWLQGIFKTGTVESATGADKHTVDMCEAQVPCVGGRVSSFGSALTAD